MNTDLQQRIILALEARGVDALSLVREGIRGVEDAMNGLERTSADGAGAREFLKQVVPLVAELERLQKIERELVASQDALKTGVYDVGHAYEVLEHAIEGADIVRSRQNANAGAWADKQKASIDSVIAEMHAYEQTSDAMTETELRNYTAIVSASNKVVQVQTNQTRSSRGASQAFLELSRGIEDFTTGGFIGILNNVPGVIQGIGQSAGISAGAVAGLTAGVSLLATGAYILIQNWDKLENYFEVGIPRPVLDGTDELKRKLKEASDITEKLGKESRLSIEELGQYKKATQDVKDLNKELERRRDLEDLLTGQSRATRERASGFKEALEESDPKAAFDALDTAINNEADDKGMVFNEIKNKATKPKELAEDLILQASKGDQRARDEVLRYLKFYKSQEGDFASNIKKFAPETIARTKKNEEVADAEDEARDVATRIAREEEEAARRKQAEVDAAVEQARRDANAIGKQEERDKAAKDREVAAAEGVAGGTASKIENEEARARKKKVDELSKGFLPQAELSIDRNRLAQATRDPSMMREAQLRASLTAETMARLKQAGEDPSLANDIIAKAFENSNDSLTRAVGQTGSQLTALIQLTESAALNVERVQSQVDLNQVQLQRLAAMNSGNRRMKAQRRTGPPF